MTKHTYYIHTYNNNRTEWISGAIPAKTPERALDLARKHNPDAFRDIDGVCVYAAQDGEGGAIIDRRKSEGGRWTRYA